jgi:hypothetical protein
MKKYEFFTTIQGNVDGKGGMFIEFPFDVQAAFGSKGRVKVLCHFENTPYRGSLVRMGTACHIIGLRKDIAKALGKGVGDSIKARIEEDTEERIIAPHPILAKALESDIMLADAYSKMSYTKKREMNAALGEAKMQKTIENRLGKMIETLRIGGTR